MTQRNGHAGKELDWQTAHRKLAKLRADLDATQNPSPERTRQILRARAAVLAKPRVSTRPAAVARLIVFIRLGHRLAIDAGQVREAVEITRLTPLPGLPSAYLGLIHHRGDVYPVIDAGVLLGMPARDAGKHTHALIVENDGAAVAIAADAIEGHATVDAASIAETAPDTATHPALRGLTPDLATVFDANQLLADARLVVNDQPSATIRGEGER